MVRHAIPHRPKRASAVAYARNISVAMTVLGLVLIAVAVIADLSPLVTVTGMLLFVAGIIKVAIVAIWKSFFSIPVEAPAQSDGPSPGGAQQGKV